MKKIGSILLAILLLATSMTGANLTGTFKLPNTALPLRNATVTFTLNQAAVIPGSFLIVPSPVSCYTSTDGSIKGLPNPLVAPSVSNNLVTGSISAGTYYVRISYTGSGPVETLVSPSHSTVLSGTGQILVTAPTLQPAAATGYNVYVGTVDGSEHLQSQVTGFGNATITTYNSGAATAPASNNSVCSFTFNDSTIPGPTTYRVGVVDSNGNSVPGFPQSWYIAGSSFDVSNGYPVATNVQTRFPQPIIANPSSNALQSINSPLSLNGYDLKPGATVFTGISTHSLSASGQAAMWYDTTQSKLLLSVNGAAAVDLLTLAPSLPLTQLQGGTNRSSAITSGQIVYSDGSAYQGTSSMTWNSSLGHLSTTGRYIVKSASQNNPASDSGSLQMFYNSSGDSATIISSSNDGSGGGSGKPLALISSTFAINIGSPSSFAAALSFDATKLGTFANYVLPGNTVVGSLPAAAAGNKGQFIVVTDSTSISAEGQTCVGSSSNVALAFSTGSAWKCF